MRFQTGDIAPSNQLDGTFWFFTVRFNGDKEGRVLVDVRDAQPGQDLRPAIAERLNQYFRASTSGEIAEALCRAGVELKVP